ncbi:MAG: hypothetical protein RIA63_15785 [Cyclobacteriaceae bacterium]
MKYSIILLATFFTWGCQNSKTTESEKTENSEMVSAPISDSDDAAGAEEPAPKDESGLKAIGESLGDLDKDGVEEKVVVYDNGNQTDMGTEREIHIYKKNGDDWEPWQHFVGGVLPSQHGGIMGDPFQELGIERGCIVTYHFGGSRYKWSYIHRFRYQNERWELIGASTKSFVPCESWESTDYNLSNGKIILEKGTEDCENGEKKITTSSKQYSNKLEVLPVLAGFYPGNNELKVEGLENSIYY